MDRKWRPRFQLARLYIYTALAGSTAIRESALFLTLSLIVSVADGAALEILNVTFSHSNFLASASGVPNYKLVIWYGNFIGSSSLAFYPFLKFLKPN